jgi:AcrR family transcriptional regulator
MSTRPYKLRKRAERQEETRKRIVEAAIHFHKTKGATNTTVDEIAERAKVGRVTVYRHFPRDDDLFLACTGTYLARNPLPDPETWGLIEDPVGRLRAGISEAYTYHQANEGIFSNAMAEARDHWTMAPYWEHWAAAADVLLAPFKARGRRKDQLRAGIALALSFDTWRTLVLQQGLNQEQAVEVAMRLAGEAPAASGASRPPSRSSRAPDR